MEVTGKGGIPESGLGVNPCKVVEVIRPGYFPTHTWEYTDTFSFLFQSLSWWLESIKIMSELIYDPKCRKYGIDIPDA